MPEIARLNLSGPVYDPMRGRDQESMSEKIRKNRQAVLSAALSAYQIKGEQHKLDQYETMKRSDMFMAHYGKDMFNNSADPTNPDSWKFTDPEMRTKMLTQWKEQVGGNYKGFMAAYEMAKKNEMDSMAKSMIRGRAGYRTDREYAQAFATDIDAMTPGKKQALMENVTPELYTQMMTLYRKGGGGPQGQDDVEGWWGFNMKNDIGDILVENFDVDRDWWDSFATTKQFIPEHWRDGWKSITTGEEFNLTPDEEVEYGQIPAYLIEAALLWKMGKGGFKKLYGVGQKLNPFGKGAKTTTSPADKTPKSPAQKTKTTPKKPKTPQQIIKEYKGVTASGRLPVDKKSKWYGKEMPNPNRYKTPKTWRKAFEEWKVANGLPKRPPKSIQQKANKKKTPKDKGGGGGGTPAAGAGAKPKTPKGTEPVANETAAKLPINKMGAAEKEIATKLSSGQISGKEAKVMREALKKLADSGDDITDAALKKILSGTPGGKSLLSRVGTGALKWAVIPMAGYGIGSSVFGKAGELAYGETGEQIGGIGGGTVGALTANSTVNILKRAYDKHGLSWIMKKIVSKGGPGLAARTLGKGVAGGFGTAFSGPVAATLTAAWIATDLHAVYNILQEAEANGEI